MPEALGPPASFYTAEQIRKENESRLMGKPVEAEKILDDAESVTSSTEEMTQIPPFQPSRETAKEIANKLKEQKEVFASEQDNTVLPTDANIRKNVPLATGVLDYFPAALSAVAQLSAKGNQQHNPGQALHWARAKSTDHADCLIRHLMERGIRDTDGIRHTVKVAWRALALLQMELEAEGAPKARGAK